MIGVLNQHMKAFWLFDYTSESKVHGANMGPIWGRQDPGGPHVDPMDFAIWDRTLPKLI